MLADGTPIALSVTDGKGVIRHARVTLRAELRPQEDTDHFDLRTAGTAIVYLSMGTASHGENAGGQHKLGLGAALTVALKKVPGLKSLSGSRRRISCRTAKRSRSAARPA